MFKFYLNNYNARKKIDTLISHGSKYILEKQADNTYNLEEGIPYFNDLLVTGEFVKLCLKFLVENLCTNKVLVQRPLRYYQLIGNYPGLLTFLQRQLHNGKKRQSFRVKGL